MLISPVLTVEIRSEDDVVLTRKRAREIAEALRFDRQDVTRIATAVSEVARNAYQYAGGGQAEFSVEDLPQPAMLIRLVDHGPGIADVAAILDGRHRSPGGTGVGLVGARRLVDSLAVESAPDRGTTVLLRKELSRGKRLPDKGALAALCKDFAQRRVISPLDELRAQNVELLGALEEVRAKNEALADTNRAVVSLLRELEEKSFAAGLDAARIARLNSEMHHEVRTPINAVLGLAGILLDGTIGAPFPAQEKPLALIRTSAAQLSKLVDEVLDLARLEAGRMPVRCERFEAKDLLAALRGVFRATHTSDAVRLTFDEEPGIPPLETEESKVAQVLRNLVSNALKFTERGEVTVRASLEARDRIVFSVRDSGIGISSPDQLRLFQPFVQVDGARQRVVKGTGLGLALSRSLAELLGGTLSLASRPGKGSTFTLTIPRVYAPPADSAAKPARKSGGDVAQAPRPCILVIDDDEGSRYILRAALARLLVPHEIVDSTGGEEGLVAARARRPSLIFLDLNMPGLSGLGVLDRLLLEPDLVTVPVIVNSAARLLPAERMHLESHALAVFDKRHHGSAAGTERLRGLLVSAGILDNPEAPS